MTSCILLPPGVGPGPRLAETSTRCAGAAALSWRACSSRRLWSAVPAGRRAQAPLAVAQDEDCDVVETREVYRASSSQREHKAGEPFLFAGSIATFTLGVSRRGAKSLRILQDLLPRGRRSTLVQQIPLVSVCRRRCWLSDWMARVSIPRLACRQQLCRLRPI